MEKPSVLLVDDNEATCVLISALLQKDFDVDTASEGGEAIEKLSVRKYDAVILDLLMPQVDGFAVLDHLKSAAPDRLGTVIVVTAAVAPSQLERVATYGIGGVVRKPFDVEVLSRAVTDVVYGSKSLGLNLMSGSLLMLVAEMLTRH